MELEQELNKRRAAPTDFWIQLVLLVIATIVIMIIVNRSRKKLQTETEKKVAYIFFKEPTKSKIVSYGKNKI